MKRTTYTSTTLLIILFLLFSTTSQATIIEINYEGTATSVDAPLAGTFSVGDDVTGRLRYDTTSTQSVILPSRAGYLGSIQLFELTIGSYTGTATGGTTVYNDDVTFHDGVYFLGGTTTGAQVNGLDLSRLQLLLYATILSTLSDFELPSVGAIDSLWANNTADGNVNFMAFSNSKEVRYSLDSVTARIVDEHSVPEPSSIALLGLGLAGLVYQRKRRIRNN